MKQLKLISKMSTCLYKRVLAVLMVSFLFGLTNAHAAVITQSFESSWTVDVWDYKGDVSAMEWHYQQYTPWDPSLGTLTSAEIRLEFAGTREDAAETVRIRSGFFTGWEPVQYQYSLKEYAAGGDATFTGDWSRSYTTPEDIAEITDFEYFTGVYDSGAGSGGAWYYFESRTDNAAHAVAAKTTLSYYYDPVSVPEPGTPGLLLMGLVGAGLARKRKSV